MNQVFSPVRAIAFFLPQFHPIPENDEWWGPGFTEWTNVTKAKPVFRGHYQPHVPRDLGYYDLRCIDTRLDQIALAKEHGIYGFCYYHYYFGGKRLLERPVNDLLSHPEIDFPFCLAWANESWTRVWDGGDKHVLMGIDESPEHDEAHYRILEPMITDPRYITIDGKPVLLVYRAEKMANPIRTTDRWRELALSSGLKGLYLIKVEHFDQSTNPAQLGFDAATQFAGPMSFQRIPRKQRPLKLGLQTISTWPATLYDYDDAVKHMLNARGDYKRFYSVAPSWDNTARRGEKASIMLGASPDKYEAWLRHARDLTEEKFVGDERVLFINAWNEWAEGCHLEPDQKYGRAYLEATKRALLH